MIEQSNALLVRFNVRKLIKINLIASKMSELFLDNCKKDRSSLTTRKGFVHQSEDEKLLEDALRPDLEKLHLFTKMLQRNIVLKKAVIVENGSFR